MNQIERVNLAMITFFAGDPKRIQHFTKVHAYAAMIARQENLSTEEQKTLELAALVHDIGIKPGEEKYGTCTGKIQEQEGPAVAERLLADCGVQEEKIRRICYLVGHHHTYDHIEGMDYQILVEADFLVNLYEKSAPKENVEQAKERIFRTHAGTWLLQTMFGL